MSINAAESRLTGTSIIPTDNWSESREVKWNLKKKS